MGAVVRVKVQAAKVLPTELKRKWAESWDKENSRTTSLQQIEAKLVAAEQRREQRREVGHAGAPGAWEVSHAAHVSLNAYE
jgi:hypothetical protein